MEGPEPLEIAPGRTHEFVLDASAYRIGSVSGQLTVEGVGASVGLTLQRTLDRTNPDGSFATDLAVGTWVGFAAVRLPESDDRATDRVNVRVYPDIVVVAGSEHTVHLQAEVARTELRIVDPAGDPVAGLWFSVIAESRPDRVAIAVTDADGRTVAVGEPGSYRVTCRIRSLISKQAHERAMQAAVEAHGGDWHAAQAALDAVFELPDPILIPASSGRVVEIRLPESWDR